MAVRPCSNSKPHKQSISDANDGEVCEIPPATNRHFGVLVRNVTYNRARVCVPRGVGGCSGIATFETREAAASLKHLGSA